MSRIHIAVCFLTLTLPAYAAEPNTLTEAEKKLGFELLFDGRSLDGWEHKNNWKVVDGTISRADKGGDIVCKKKKIPDDFELVFDWKVGPGSNSGVYYRPTQIEYQILDNAKHADGKNPRTSAASLYFCMAPSKDATKPVGEWNEGRILCRGSVIQHWLNGVKVIDFDYADPQWEDDVEMMRIRGGDLKARGAYMLLQDHGDPVWYRSIKLRPVSKDEKLDRTPVKPMPIPPEARAKELDYIEKLLKEQKEKKNKK
jgi:hypothetical protein